MNKTARITLVAVGFILLAVNVFPFSGYESSCTDMQVSSKKVRLGVPVAYLKKTNTNEVNCINSLKPSSSSYEFIAGGLIIDLIVASGIFVIAQLALEQFMSSEQRKTRRKSG